jgi:hypothetical protein
MLLFGIGHSAFGAGVAVTIVRTSRVGVKVGMVGSGVMVGGAGVSVGKGVALGAREALRSGVAVRVGMAVMGNDGVETGVVTAGAQAESKTSNKVSKRAGFKAFLFSKYPIMHSTFY